MMLRAKGRLILLFLAAPLVLIQTGCVKTSVEIDVPPVSPTVTTLSDHYEWKDYCCFAVPSHLGKPEAHRWRLDDCELGDERVMCYSSDSGMTWKSVGYDPKKRYRDFNVPVLIIRSMFAAGNGKLFMGFTHGVLLVSDDDGKNWHLLRETSEDSDSLDAIFSTPDGRLWIAINNMDKRISSLYELTGQGSEQLIGQFSGLVIRQIARSQDGTLLAAVRGYSLGAHGAVSSAPYPEMLVSIAGNGWRRLRSQGASILCLHGCTTLLSALAVEINNTGEGENWIYRFKVPPYEDTDPHPFVLSTHEKGILAQKLKLLFANPTGERLYATTGSKFTPDMLLESFDDGITWVKTRTLPAAFKTATATRDDIYFAYGTSFWIGRSTGKTLVPIHARLNMSPVESILELQTSRQLKSGEHAPIPELVVEDSHVHSDEKLHSIVGPTKAVSTTLTDKSTWVIKFQPEKFNIHPGDSMFLTLRFEDEGLRYSIEFPPTIYKKWEFLKPFLPELASALAVVVWVLSLISLYILYPLRLLKLHETLRRQTSEIRLKGISDTLQFAFSQLLLSQLAYSDRALAAWVESQAPEFQRLLDYRMQNRQFSYVPLPVAVLGSILSKTIDEPTPKTLSPLFDQKRSLVQIIAPGGAGKTTLALAIAEWAFRPFGVDRLHKHRMIPVIVDKDINVVEHLKTWFRSTFGIESSDLLFLSLLERKHVLVIADGLSEKSAEVQAGVSKIFADLPIGALIITSRRVFEMEGVVSWQVRPQPVSAQRLVGFVMALLLQKGEKSFSDPRLQLRLASHITEIFMTATEQASDLDENVSLTPLLVKLIVDRALELGTNRLEELPKSIPRVYFEFLTNLNRTSDLRARVSDETYFELVCKLAKLALGDNFIPGREFRKDEAFANFQESERDEVETVLASLAENGILVARSTGPFTHYSFSLDPLSEYLAAFAYYRQNIASGARWSEFIKEVGECGDVASGFRTALELTARAYDTSGLSGADPRTLVP